MPDCSRCDSHGASAANSGGSPHDSALGGAAADDREPDRSTADDQTVIELCRRAVDRDGDVRQIVEDEVRRIAPLRVPRDQRDLAERAIARLNGLGRARGAARRPDRSTRSWSTQAPTSGSIAAGRSRVPASCPTNASSTSIERILAPIGRRVDRTSPIVDARLPDGSRVCAVLPPVAVHGAVLSIRRFSVRRPPAHRLRRRSGGAELCREIVRARCNVIVSGATSSGKTSLLSALVDRDRRRRAAGRRSRTRPSCRSPRTNVVRLEARPALADGPPPVELDDLVRAALRLRPDRIVVGEVRGVEVLALVQALNTGHDGSLSTCHANGPVDTLLRLESLVLQAAPAWPLDAIRHQIQRSIDVIVHVARRSDGRRRSPRSPRWPTADGAGDRQPAIRMLADDRGGRARAGRRPAAAAECRDDRTARSRRSRHRPRTGRRRVATPTPPVAGTVGDRRRRGSSDHDPRPRTVRSPVDRRRRPCNGADDRRPSDAHPLRPDDVARWCDDLARRVRAGSSLGGRSARIHERRARRCTPRRHRSATPSSAARRSPSRWRCWPRWTAPDAAHRPSCGPSAPGQQHLALACSVIAAVAEVGGSAAPALDRAASALRLRAIDRDDRATHAAQARLSAHVLTVLPLLMLSVLVLADADVRDVVIAGRVGATCVLIGATLNLVGWWWMRRVIGAPTMTGVHRPTVATVAALTAAIVAIGALDDGHDAAVTIRRRRSTDLDPTMRATRRLATVRWPRRLHSLRSRRACSRSAIALAALVVLGPFAPLVGLASVEATRRRPPVLAATPDADPGSRTSAPDAVELFVLLAHAGLTPVQAVRELSSTAPEATRTGFAGVTHRLERGDTFADALGGTAGASGPEHGRPRRPRRRAPTATDHRWRRCSSRWPSRRGPPGVGGARPMRGDCRSACRSRSSCARCRRSCCWPIAPAVIAALSSISVPI